MTGPGRLGSRCGEAGWTSRDGVYFGAGTSAYRARGAGPADGIESKISISPNTLV